MKIIYFNFGLLNMYIINNKSSDLRTKPNQCMCGTKGLGDFLSSKYIKNKSDHSVFICSGVFFVLLLVYCMLPAPLCLDPALLFLMLLFHQRLTAFSPVTVNS